MKQVLCFIVFGFWVTVSLSTFAWSADTKLIAPFPLMLQHCLIPNSKTIYVDADAASEGSGTRKSPFKTLARLLTHLQSASSTTRVCLTGMFSETLELSKIASPDLAFYGYGSSAAVGNGQSYGITNDSSHGHLKTLSLTDVDVTGTTAIGVYLNNLDSVTMSGIAIDGSGTTPYGIILDTVTTANLKNLSITDITGEGINAYRGNAFSLDDFTITGDMSMAVTIYDTETIEISQGEASNYTDYGVYLHDTDSVVVSHIDFDGSDTASSGIYVDVNSEALIDNNFVRDHMGYGIRAGGDAALIEIYNNSLSGNNYGLYMEGTSYVENNIIASLAGQCGYNPRGASILVSDYNLFEGDAVLGDDGDCLALSDWQTLGYDANSLSGDPQFISSADLHLQSSSPAINAGTPLWTDFSDDIDGDARDAAFDIGADEF